MPIPQVNDRIKEAPVVMLRAVFAGIGQILLTADKVRSRAAEQAWTPERPAAPGKVGQAPACQSPREPRNGALHAEPAATGHPFVPEAAAGPGTAAAAPAAGPAAKAVQATTTTPVAKATKPAPVTKTTKSGPAAKTRPAAKTTKSTPAAKAVPAPRAARTTKPAPASSQAPATKPAPAAKPKAASAAKPKAVPAPRAAKAGPDPQTPPLPGYDDLSLASLRARLRGLDATTIEAMLAYEKGHARREPVITMLERRLAKLTAG